MQAQVDSLINLAEPEIVAFLQWLPVLCKRELNDLTHNIRRDNELISQLSVFVAVDYSGNWNLVIVEGGEYFAAFFEIRHD